MKKWLLHIVFVFIWCNFFAQVASGRLADFHWSTTENRHVHSAILPLIRQSSTFDSLVPWIDSTDKKRRYLFQPAIDSYIQYDTSFHFRTAAGVNFEKSWKKIYNRTSLIGGWSSREDHTQNHAAFVPITSAKQAPFIDFRTRFTYTPNEFLHISTGIDNQFFGEGYRSLIQGDQVAPSPYFQLRTNFWHLEYGILYQFLHENNLSKNRLDWKYNTLHYLSWNATRNWNITLLESVTFQGKDSTYRRGYEVEYLNPFVFFRPQEYSLGSTDNILLAAQTSVYYLKRKHAVYLQFVLDEFVLKAIMKRTKWWANKYALQLGFKGIFKKWNYLVEGNIVRPYTFSHINSRQSGGNLGRPLGHYLGSNFVELLAQAQIPMKFVSISFFSSFVLKGFDESAQSMGGDIYKNYITHPKEYGNTIGQGLTQRFVNFQARISTYISKLQWELYFQTGFQYQWGELKEQTIPTLTFGIRSNLFQNRRLY